MKIVRTLADDATDCVNGVDCPACHVLDDGRLLVRGYVTSTPAGVTVPTDARTCAVLRRLASPHVVDLDARGVLVVGEPVTDPAALLGRPLPVDERAVIIPIRTLAVSGPSLQEVCGALAA